MTFFSLSDTLKGYILAAVFICFITLILALVSHISLNKNKGTMQILVILSLIALIDLSALKELTSYWSEESASRSSDIAVFVDNIPYYNHIIFAVLGVGFSFYSIYKLYVVSSNTINEFSIKEAIESLPSGIAFMSPSNELYLSNRIMQDLCKKLTDKDLMSGTDLWEDLSKLKSSAQCVIGGNNPAFMLSDGKVWQFTRALCKWETGDYYEIKTTDITELYNLRRNTEEVNEVLSKQQIQLKNLTSMIEKNTEEEIAANMKVSFHDNFGNLLTLTKHTLQETTELDETKVLAKHFEQLSEIITDLASDKNQGVSYEEIITLGEKLDCKVILQGELPAQEEIKNKVLLCINEALKNAYLHANAKELIVTIGESEETVEVSIYNETKNILSNITEGGGLSGLRRQIEKMNGKFSINVENGVRINIVLNKIIIQNKEIPCTIS